MEVTFSLQKYYIWLKRKDERKSVNTEILVNVWESWSMYNEWEMCKETVELRKSWNGYNFFVAATDAVAAAFIYVLFVC